MKNAKNVLWSYGISGDLPIVLVIIKKYEDIDSVYEVIKAHEYWRIKGIIVDLVLVSQEEISYNHPLWNSVYEVVMASHLTNLQGIRGGVFLLRGESISKEEIDLLKKLANIVSEDGKFVSEREEEINDKRYKKKYVAQKGDHINRKDVEFYNGIGGFDVKNNEYVIYPSKENYTPLPWCNILANKDFGTITTEAGGGYTWAFNSREFRITPWSNDVVSDKQGEYVYVEDVDTGERFSPYLLPYEGNGEYEVDFGLGYTKYVATVSGFLMELTIFVPLKSKIKFSIFKIKNKTDKVRNIKVGYFLNPVLAFSEELGKKHVEIEFDNDKIKFRNNYEKEFQQYEVILNSSERGEFIKKKTGVAIEVNYKLDKIEEKEQIIAVGLDLADFSKTYDELEKVKEFYKNELLKVRVNTPDRATNLLLNGFLVYQALVCRIWGRSSFYQSGGAIGFRDQLQDVIPFSYILPSIAREQILFHAKHQFQEGDVLHWWHNEAQKGTRTKFSDDLLWLAYVTERYIEITDDQNILNEQIEFVEGVELQENENEKYIEFEFSSNTASLFAHCVFAIEHGLKYGEHGLLLMGAGDWNDGMNEVGCMGKGESVWLTWFMYKILVDFAPLCRIQNRSDLADKYSGIAGKLVVAVNENGWDGEWYKRAFFDDGTALGSVESEECKIDSISQSWGILSGGADEEKRKKAMASLDNYLIDRENRIIKLLTPPFSKSKVEPGYIKSYPEGVRENGGQYTHAAIWAGIAYAMMREGNRAFEIFDILNPINHSRTEGEMRKYKLEPYVIAADIYSNPQHVGRGGWSWYTGAASWMYSFGIEFILGFKKRGNKIIIDPVVKDDWNEYEIEYRFNNTIYKIKVNLRSDKKGKIVINNILENGNSFELIDDGGIHFIEANI